jgi:hypothetical protein
LFSVIVWQDIYQCSECGEQAFAAVDLPAIPWGEHLEHGENRGLRAYPDVRHPNFADTWPGFDENQPHPEGDGVCRSCGGYAFSGLLCDGCRADGWTDWYGMVSEPDPEDRRCPECGGDVDSGYGCDC